MSPISLRYCEGLKTFNTWRLSGALVEARVKIASAADVVVTVGVRRHAVKLRESESAETTFVRQLDEALWATGLVRHPDLPLSSFFLIGAPEGVSAAWRALPDHRG
jgi:hypothetical protein